MIRGNKSQVNAALDKLEEYDAEFGLPETLREYKNIAVRPVPYRAIYNVFGNYSMALKMVRNRQEAAKAKAKAEESKKSMFNKPSFSKPAMTSKPAKKAVE